MKLHWNTKIECTKCKWTGRVYETSSTTDKGLVRYCPECNWCFYLTPSIKKAPTKGKRK